MGWDSNFKEDTKWNGTCEEDIKEWLSIIGEDAEIGGDGEEQPDKCDLVLAGTDAYTGVKAMKKMSAWKAMKGMASMNESAAKTYVKIVREGSPEIDATFLYNEIRGAEIGQLSDDSYISNLICFYTLNY